MNASNKEQQMVSNSRLAYGDVAISSNYADADLELHL